MSPPTLRTVAMVDERPDAELIVLVRGGDLGAFGALYGRHAPAAERLARQLAPGPDADDLVADAFDRVLDVLRRGGGPDEAFRAYLLTTLRRRHVDRIRAERRVQATDDVEPLTAGVPFTDTAVAGFETGAAARAFASLPERWQLVLWHTEVEGQRPAEVAPLLGISANSVAALAYRAREGLRRAFLTMHAQDDPDGDCGRVVALLGGFVRGGLSRRDRATVRDHLDDCRSCTGIYLELAEVNAGIGALLAPALLGGAGAGYVGGALGGGVAAVAGGVGAPGSAALLLTRATAALLARLRDLLGRAGSAATSAGAGAAGGVAVALAIAGGGVLAIQQGGQDPGPEPGAGASPPSGPDGGGAGGPGGSGGAGGAGGSGGAGGAGDARAGGSVSAPAGGGDTQDVSAPDPARGPARNQAPQDGPGDGGNGSDGPAPGGPAPSGPAPGDPAPSDPAPSGPAPSGPAHSDSPGPGSGGSGSGGSGSGGAGGAQDGHPPEADRDLRVRAESRREAAHWRVRVRVAGLGPDGSATVTFGADRPSVVVRLDRHCDLVAVGRARCRVSGGPTVLDFRARPLPRGSTNLRFVVSPAGGTRDTRPGNESDAVRLTGRLSG